MTTCHHIYFTTFILRHLFRHPIFPHTFHLCLEFWHSLSNSKFCKASFIHTKQITYFCHHIPDFHKLLQAETASMKDCMDTDGLNSCVLMVNLGMARDEFYHCLVPNLQQWKLSLLEKWEDNSNLKFWSGQDVVNEPVVDCYRFFRHTGSHADPASVIFYFDYLLVSDTCHTFPSN